MFVGGFVGFVLDNTIPGNNILKKMIKTKQSHLMHVPSKHLQVTSELCLSYVRKPSSACE